MRQHQVYPEDILGGEVISHLASSTSRGQRLEIVTKISDKGLLTSLYRVSWRKSSFPLLETTNLNKAIELYNTLKDKD